MGCEWDAPREKWKINSTSFNPTSTLPYEIYYHYYWCRPLQSTIQWEEKRLKMRVKKGGSAARKQRRVRIEIGKVQKNGTGHTFNLISRGKISNFLPPLMRVPRTVVCAPHYGVCPALWCVPFTVVCAVHYGVCPALWCVPRTMVCAPHYGVCPALWCVPCTMVCARVMVGCVPCTVVCAGVMVASWEEKCLGCST